MQMKRLLLIAFGFLAAAMGLPFDKTPKNDNNSGKQKRQPAFLSVSDTWSDSVFAALSPDQRLGQLFMIAAYSNKDNRHTLDIENLIKKYAIGGIIWMQGTPLKQGKLAGYFQTISKVPLLYSMDAEWGLSMRLDSVPRYPRSMTLGAMQNDSLVFYAGKQIAADCKRMGLHINFAPDADVNNNAANPVIGIRSFGEDKAEVARRAALYMAGMQSEHVLACAKHFPGHGDTETDSHHALPLVDHSFERLDSLELFPFKKLIDAGIGSVMVAHLQIPAIDSTKDLPASLSPRVIEDLLKHQLGFEGLVFTDALNMKGAMGLSAGKAEVLALQAGADVLLMSPDVGKAITQIKLALDSGILKQKDIDDKIKKILKLKYWCGLYKTQKIVTRTLTAELNSQAANKLNEQLAAAAITVLQNKHSTLPLMFTDSTRLLEITVGSDELTPLFSTLSEFTTIEHAGLSHTATAEQLSSLRQKVGNANQLIIQINRSNLKPEANFGLSAASVNLIDSLTKLKPSILVVFGIPYLLNQFKNLADASAIVLAYENTVYLQKACALAIAGINGADGKLPVSLTNFPLATSVIVAPVGIAQQDLTRKYYEKKFKAVDSLALQGIAEKAYPGCQIVAMLDGKLIYQKSFGAYTYDQHAKPVDNATMYDLASLTKVLSSAFALIKLQSEGKFDYNRKVCDYLPEYSGTPIGERVLEDVLTHQAGLPAWIPFYQTTLDKNNKYKKGYYAAKASEQFPVQVAEDLYTGLGMRDSLMTQILKSKLKDRGSYLYSDLGYYFTQQIIERLSGKSLDNYVSDLYTKTGISLTYRPLRYFSKTQIAPTENDLTFRKQLIQGYVHDPGAALLGGVAGHAGLFGTATEVAKLMELYRNMGSQNAWQVLDSNVVKDYTSCHFCPQNRRGLCFEKPEPDARKESPVAAECSLSSFGHSGFTGTFAWADPAKKLVIVFLSNRVYPSATENKLVKLGTRTKIQQAFYKALSQTN